MFQDLDAALRKLLGDDAAPDALRAAEVSFDTPDRDFTPTQPTLDLFLHEVSENRALREPGPVRERGDGTVLSRTPPLRVDCGYLVTAWSARAGGVKAEEEHRLLGLALMWLSRFPVLGQRFVSGSLTPAVQPFRLPLSVAQTREGEQLSHFWSALGIPPRPAFSLTVTVAMPVADAAVTLPRVRGVTVRPVLDGVPALAGRVLDPAEAPVAAADVSVVQTGARSTTGADGRFRFAGLDFGSYTLLVEVPGRPGLEVPVRYRPGRQIHDAILPDA